MTATLILVVVFAFSTLFFDVQSAYGASPTIINHQGRLLNAAGSLLGGDAGTNYCFQFSFFDDATVGGGDVEIWPGGPSTMTVEVVNGIYNVGIGDTTAGGDALDFDFNSDDEIYLNIEVAELAGVSCTTGGDEVFENLEPRQRIFSSGYAINANTVLGFTPSQTPTGSQIPVLSGGNLTFGGASTISTSAGTALTLDSGTTGALNLGTGSSAKTISVGTGTAGNTINIGTNNTTLDTINIGSALDDVAITGDQWSITNTGVLTVVSCTGCGGGGATLDSAYTTGNTIGTDSGSNVIINLSEVVTPTEFTVNNLDTAGTNAVQIDSSIASGTLTNGLLIEQSGAGTMTNAIQIAETAGTITDGILITGTLGNILNSASIDITGAGAITGATAITVDDITINANTISSAGASSLSITPTAGQAILLDGTISIDAGVVTGATSITSTAFIGALTGAATDLNCTDCINATEIEDIFLLNSGDTGTGTFNFDGDLNVGLTDGSSANIDGDATPTADILVLGSGDTSATDGVDALQITFGVDDASGNLIDLTPSYLDDAGDVNNETLNVIDIDAFTATINDAGDTGVVRGLNIGALTQTETAGTITANAIAIGAGWDNVIDSVDFDVDADGFITLTSDGAGDQINATSGNADYQFLVLNATAVDVTNQSGVIDLNIDSGDASNVMGISIDLAQSDGATASSNAIGQQIRLSANDADGDVTGLFIQALSTVNAAAGSYQSGILIQNDENVTGSMTRGLWVLAGTDGAITTGVEVSDAEIVNAIDVGANNIVGTGAVINFTGFDVDASGNIIALTLDTGQGANELFDMDQNVLTTSSPTFVDLTLTGGDILGANSDSIDVAELADATFTFIRNTTGTITIIGADDAGAADTTYDTTGAGAITIGSADVTAITLSTDATGDGTDVVLPTGAIGTLEILNDTIDEDDLDVTGADAGGDEECLTFESTGGTGDFEWQDCASGVTWDEIGDPVGASSITFGDGETSTFVYSHTVGDQNAFIFDVNQVDDAVATDDLDVIRLDLTSESGDAGDTFDGIVINWENGTANTILDSGLKIDNAETTASTLTDAIIVTSSGVSGGVVDALDVSDTNITNALNVGDNTILGTGAVINFTGFDVDASGNITVAAAQGLDTNGAGALELGFVNATSVLVGSSATTAVTIVTDNNSASDVAITGGLTVTSAGTHNSFTITSSADTEHAQVITANSLTSGHALDIATSSTTGAAVYIADSSGDTVGAEGILYIRNTDSTLTQQQYLIQGSYVDSADTDADFLLFEDNSGNDKFVVSRDGDIFIDGTAEGTAAITIDGGDITLTDGDINLVSGDLAINTGGNFDLLSGDFNVTLSGTADASISKTATGTAAEEGLEITFNATTGVDVDQRALVVDVDSANHSASTDVVVGLDIENLTGADAEGTETAIRIGTGWDNILDTVGFDVVNTTGATTIAGSALGTDALTLTAGDILLTSGNFDMTSGDFNVNLVDGQTANIDGDGSPTADILTIGSGDTSATDGVDGLQITFTSDDASGNLIDLTPVFTDNDAGNNAETWNVIDVDALTVTQNDSGGAITGVVRGLNIGALTESATGDDAITSTAILVGSGWDTGLSINGRADILANTENTYISGGNFAVFDALSDNNTIIGYQALSSASVSGADAHTALGVGALASITTGDNNIAIGYLALNANTNGNSNIAIGNNALTLTDGIGSVFNTVVGINAATANTTGNSNTVLGYSAFPWNETGSSNTVIGYQAGGGGAAIENNITGNTALGRDAGRLLNDGNNNVLIGHDAGDQLTSGDQNIVIGYDIDAPSATDSNQLSIGNLIFGTGIDGADTTISTGNIGIGVVAPGALLDIDTPDASSITAEQIQLRSSATAQTLTDGTTIADWRNNQFIAPTLNGVAAGGTETVTNASTLYIDAAPSGSNITITNPYALFVDAGNARFDGLLIAGSANEVLTLSTGKIDADAITLFAGGNGVGIATSATGLETESDGLSLLQGCGDTQILKWEEDTDTWDCAGDATSGTFGTDNQIPFVNAGGTDFDYSAKFTFDGDSLDITNSALTDTTGGLDINITTVTDAVSGINLDFTNDEGAGASTAYGAIINIDNNATTNDDTVFGLYLDNENSGDADADKVADALLVIDNSDTGDPVIDGIRFISAGGGFTDYIDTPTIDITGAGAITGATAITIAGSEGSTVSTVTAGDAVISDGSLAITDDDNDASFSTINNTATTFGETTATGVNALSSTTLTTGDLLELRLTESALTTGNYLTAYDATAGASVFEIGEDGIITAGTSNTVLTLATGMIDADAVTLFAGGDGVGITTSATGLETESDGLSLLQGCADEQILRWEESTDTWDCSAESGALLAVGHPAESKINDTASDQDFTSIYTIPANYLTENKVLRVTFGMGMVAGTSTATHNQYVKLGGTKVIQGNVGTDATNGITRIYSMVVYIVGTAAAGASVPVESSVIYAVPSTGAYSNIAQPVNLATNGTLSIVNGVTWSATGSTETMTLRTFLVEELVNIGADLAEIYGTKDGSVESGDVVSLDSSLNAGVKKSDRPYDPTAFGIISTSPGLIMGVLDDPGTIPVLVALSGRVPVKVTTENGPIQPGDLLTSSSLPGVAMRATKAGQIIGQAMQSFEGEGVGSVLAFIKTSYGNGAGVLELLPGLSGEDTASISPDIGKLALAQLMEQKEQLGASVNLSEITTDRLMAGLEVITPRVVADKVETNTISSSTGTGIEVSLNEGGVFTIGGETTETITNEDGTTTEVATPAPVITFDALGNAVFAGEVTAKKFNISEIAGLSTLSEEVALLSDGQEAITLTASAVESLSNMLNVLSGDVIVLKENGVLLEERVATVETALTTGIFKDEEGLVSLDKLLVTGEAKFEGETTFDGLTFFNANSTFAQNVIFSGGVEFTVPPIFNADTAGFAIIREGANKVEVVFDNAYVATPVVNATMTYEEEDNIDEETAQEIFEANIQSIVVNKSTGGFTILLNQNAPRDIRFSWSALAVKDAKVFEGIIPGLTIEEETQVPVEEVTPPAPEATATPPEEIISPEETSSAEEVVEVAPTQEEVGVPIENVEIEETQVEEVIEEPAPTLEEVGVPIENVEIVEEPAPEPAPEPDPTE